MKIHLGFLAEHKRMLFRSLWCWLHLPELKNPKNESGVTRGHRPFSQSFSIVLFKIISLYALFFSRHVDSKEYLAHLTSIWIISLFQLSRRPVHQKEFDFNLLAMKAIPHFASTRDHFLYHHSSEPLLDGVISQIGGGYCTSIWRNSSL